MSPRCSLPPGPEGTARLVGPEGAAGLAEPESSVEAAGGEAEGGRGPRRALRAVYVRSESSQGAAAERPEAEAEAGALKCLLRACEAEGAHLTSISFGELDFGETAVLDAFYDAGEGACPLDSYLPPAVLALSQALPPLHSLPWPSLAVPLPSSHC